MDRRRAPSDRSDAGEPWSNWQRLDPAWNPPPAVLAETLDGGQAFRWSEEAGTWTGLWARCAAQLRLDASGAVEWRAPAAAAPEVAAELPRYLAADRDWPALTDSLPWRSDPHLARCVGAFPGLRILRQPFGETLLGFLCSATKQIVQIKQMLALLATAHGDALPFSVSPPPGSPASSSPSRSASALPSWSALANIPEAELRRSQLGFRARYIHQTARFLAQNPGWLDTTESLPYPEAKARLMELPGVGGKVADCVLLFGAGRLEAFPVDTWVLKSLERRYGLVGWKPVQVAQFGRAHFGPLAGLAQQYLFAWERSFSRTKSEARAD